MAGDTAEEGYMLPVARNPDYQAVRPAGWVWVLLVLPRVICRWVSAQTGAGYQLGAPDDSYSLNPLFAPEVRVARAPWRA